MYRGLHKIQSDNYAFYQTLKIKEFFYTVQNKTEIAPFRIEGVHFDKNFRWQSESTRGGITLIFVLNTGLHKKCNLMLKWAHLPLPRDLPKNLQANKL